MTSSGDSFVLGLDLGSNSVGWAILKEGKDGVAGLLDAGVRIFEAGTEGDIEKGKDEPRGMERRMARQRRRQAERRSRRMENLACLLRRNVLLPDDAARRGGKRDAAFRALDQMIYARYRAALGEDAPELIALRQLPYFLRARALDVPLERHELGRALYHLAQRRGYLSNRKANKKDDDRGLVEPAIHSLQAEMDAARARTLGEYLSRIDPVQEQRIRKRWTARRMYQEEFEAIWQAQRPHHGKLLTDALKEQVYECIFDQRPLKSQRGLVGECDLVPGKRRAPIALLNAQRFRLLQKVNDLEVCFADGTQAPLTPEQRQKALDRLDAVDEITFPGLRSLLKLKGTEFNFERGGEKKFPGNKTSKRLRDVFAERWDAFSRAEQDAIIGEVMGIQKPETLARRGREVWGLDAEAAERFAKVNLESGHCSLSREALKSVLPLMEQGKRFVTARDEAFGGLWSRIVNNALAPVAEACPSIRNPVVMRTLSEMRRVVNAIIQKYGKPSAIRIELARELKKTREQRQEISKNINKRRDRREEFAEIAVKETGNKNPSRRDIERIQLWKECREECPYTGKRISRGQLLGPESPWDVEHIIPFSRCLDDSFLNKTLCYHEENRNVKKNQTPWEAYGETPAWDDIIARVSQFQGDAAREKLRRFQLRDLEDFDTFTERQLNDTRYASRLAAQYLSWLYGDEAKSRIQVSTGQVTAYLRNAWNLNKILGDGGEKERSDHRHHAVDAIAIALTERRHVKALSDAAARQFNEKGRSRGFQKLVEMPWNGFFEDVQQVIGRIVVSHRPERKVAGVLHDDSIYSPPRTDKDGNPYVVIRKPLDANYKASDIEDVADPEVRRILKDWLEKHDNNPKRAFGDPKNHPAIEIKNGPQKGQCIPIHKVRMKFRRDVTPIGQDERLRHVWTRSNSHIEIFALKNASGSVIKWEGRVVTRLDAYQRVKHKLPVVNRTWTEKHEFLFSLTQGDIIELDVNVAPDGVQRAPYTVLAITFDSGGRIEAKHIRDARKKADIPSTPTGELKVLFRPRPVVNALMKLNCRKLTITPLGEVFPAND